MSFAIDSHGVFVVDYPSMHIQLTPTELAFATILRVLEEAAYNEALDLTALVKTFRRTLTDFDVDVLECDAVEDALAAAMAYDDDYTYCSCSTACALDEVEESDEQWLIDFFTAIAPPTGRG